MQCRLCNAVHTILEFQVVFFFGDVLIENGICAKVIAKFNWQLCFIDQIIYAYFATFSFPFGCSRRVASAVQTPRCRSCRTQTGVPMSSKFRLQMFMWRRNQNRPPRLGRTSRSIRLPSNLISDIPHSALSHMISSYSMYSTRAVSVQRIMPYCLSPLLVFSVRSIYHHTVSLTCYSCQCNFITDYTLI